MCAQIVALLEEVENSHQVIESLKLSGHNIIACKNYTEAIAYLQDKEVDLIISDVHLENGGNIFDFLKWAKKNSLTYETPFVLFSFCPTYAAKYIEDGVRTSARMLGATKYLTMDSFDAEKFREQIDSVLQIDDTDKNRINLKKENGNIL